MIPSSLTNNRFCPPEDKTPGKRGEGQGREWESLGVLDSMLIPRYGDAAVQRGQHLVAVLGLLLPLMLSHDTA